MGGRETRQARQARLEKASPRCESVGDDRRAALTDATTDDALTGITLLEAVAGDVASVTADPAYDTLAFYDAATDRGAKVVVPPAKTARLSPRRPRSRARDRTIRRITQIGRRRWKKEAGYHRQARVENAVFRYKSILGDGLR